MVRTLQESHQLAEFFIDPQRFLDDDQTLYLVRKTKATRDFLQSAPASSTHLLWLASF
jgi:hypothetical protein